MIRSYSPATRGQETFHRRPGTSFLYVAMRVYVSKVDRGSRAASPLVGGFGAVFRAK